MSVLSAVPIPVFGPTGYIIPSDPAIFAGRSADWVSGIPGLVVPATPPTPGTAATPQGQLIASETAIIGAAYAQFLYVTNQFNPSLSSGRWQDGLGYIYFLTRIASAPTVTQVQCNGGQNVQIPVGALIRAADGNLYSCTEAGAVPASGSITLSFACVNNGPISCPAQTFQIFQNIPGWDSAVSTEPGVEGNNTETAAQFEARRKQSVAANAQGSNASILGSILALTGVLDCYVISNTTGSPITITDQTLAPHSLYVCVAGGASQAIAQAIWIKKSDGCDMNGNVSVTVLDPNYGPPQPSYTIKYQSAAPTPTLFAVTLFNSSAAPANALTLIQGAIQAAFAGADGGSRARIGSTLFASRYYAGIASLGSWAQIISLKIGSTSANYASAGFAGSITGTTLTVSSVTSGAIAIGQSLFDATGVIIPGTVITAGSGSSWTVNNSQTVTSETITSAVASLNDLTMPIDQIPVLSNANITLTLASS